jgi:hypothetical protein
MPTLPSDAITEPLADGEVPQALMGVVRDWPAAVGSQWVYRYGEYMRGGNRVATWEGGVITRTIVAAWQLAPDVMLSRISEVRVANRPGAEAHRSSSYLYTFRDGLVFDLKDVSLEQARLILSGRAHEAGPAPFHEERYLNEVFRLPVDAWLSPSPEDFERNAVVREAPLDSAVGRLDDCHVVQVPGYYASVTFHRYCRGVGVVRMDDLPGATSYCGARVLELVEYTLPTLMPVGER